MDDRPSSDDLREFLRLLTAHEVAFLLVGGYAVALHGYPRATADFDLWIDLAPDNIERVLRVLGSSASPRRMRSHGHSPRLGRSCAWVTRRRASNC